MKFLPLISGTVLLASFASMTTAQTVLDSVTGLSGNIKVIHHGARVQVSDSIIHNVNTVPQHTVDNGISNLSNVEINNVNMAAMSSATIEAGRTSSSLDVSAAGGAIFTIPFSLPKGITNVTPRLGLSYNSQSGNGVAGVGWNLLGTSSITRIGNTTYHDGQIKAVNFDQNDRFALDGQRLLLKSGVYGGDGAEYQTENYSNVRILSYGVSPYGAAYGPEYFLILYPDGSRAYYGKSTNSRSRTDYAITYSDNVSAARINFTYTQSNNVLYITKVGYGTRSSVASINEVNFIYTTVSRPEHAYTGGQSVFRDKLLSKITIVSNGVNYRHYNLTHGTMGTLNFQRLTSIQELDGSETKAFEPISFNYGSTGDAITSHHIDNLSLSGIASNNSQTITADFTGNGSIDFLVYPSAKDKFWAFYDLEPNSPYMQLGYEVNTGTFRELFPTTWLSSTNKLLSGQGIGLVKSNGYNSYKFVMYSSGTTAPVYYQYERVWNNVPLGPGYYSGCDYQYYNGSPLFFDFVSGDFNGDGLTDILAIARSTSVITGKRWSDPDHPPPPPTDPPLESITTAPASSTTENAAIPPPIGHCITDYGQSGSPAFFINLDRRLESNFTFNLNQLYPYYATGDKLLTADVNGDGKTDLIHVKSGIMTVYSLNQAGTTLQTLWQKSDSRVVTDQPILLGDYNSDGKADIMFSTGFNSLFATFISTGKDFVKYEQNQPFSNTDGSWDGTPGVEKMQLYYLIANDINGDGKTDIIKAKTTTKNNSTNGTFEITVHHNLGNANTGAPTFSGGTSNARNAHLKHYPAPVFLNPAKMNNNQEFGFISDNSISLFKFAKDYRKESQLTSIVQDGIAHSIQYDDLMAGKTNGDILFYQSDYDQTYPYVNLYNLPGFQVVRKISRMYGSEQITKIFSYAGGVSHSEGLGFLGFKELIKSNWHIENSNDRIFNISINDPQLRGANVRNFTSKYTYINPTIKNTILTNPPPANGIQDGASISDYLSRNDQVYTTQILSNKVFINAPVGSCSKDMLAGTFSTQTIEYDAFYNPLKTTSNANGLSTQTLEMTYSNNPTSNTSFRIGRLLTRKNTITTGTDITSGFEEYTYTSNLVSQLKRKGKNTSYISENYIYDAFGNVTQHTTIAPEGTQRLSSREYDASGRFMTSETDIDGLITTYAVNVNIGTLTNKTNPFGQVESYLYDNWGRQLLLTDCLNHNTTRQYQKNGSDIEITDTDDEGRYKKVTINALGQTLETREKNVLGQIIGKSWRFDAYGRLISESVPVTPGSSIQWNLSAYDEYGRLKQTVSYTGKTVNITYNGLSSTINDGVKSVTTTKNALGQVNSVQDPGGLITYAYYADGNMKSLSYGSITTSIEQDGWGRRIKMIDPSAGTFSYEYDGFDQLKKEISPNGVTEYSYDNVGKPLTKKIIGDQTNMQYVYTYDPVTKLITSTALTNADGNNTNYTYTYDTHKRLINTIEDNLHARFETAYTFDGYGRPITETHIAKNKLNNISMQKTVEIQYQFGLPLQQTLQGSNQLLWKTTGTDNSGRITTFLQGNTKTTMSYDQYGLPQQTKLDKVTTPQTLMILGYNFNAQQGQLDSRSNSAFSWNESFTYDNLNRLTNFNDNSGNYSQTYDSKGRISNNSQLGDYSYESDSFRQTELNNLTTTTNSFYQARPLQQITFNAFKRPVDIVEQDVERVSFQYNGNLQRAHMYYGDYQTDKMLRRYRKHYAEDGSVEIINDIQLGKTTFVFYLGGDAYSASAIWKETYSGGTSSGNKYFLHRDHLNSIVMITNAAGDVVERRQFDAWGNVVRFTDGAGNTLSLSAAIIDRGYTGHEHILGGALINMNGRIYDPRLHRFLSPDNFVQDPFNSQNLNRYAYAKNNPLMFTDPNGEFLHLIIGAVVGGLVNWIAHGADFSWKGLAYFGVGAVSGALGAGVGAGVSSVLIGGSFGAGFVGSCYSNLATSFISGALVGSAGGAAGGFASGLGNGIVDGKSFGNALKSGINSGVMGGISGAVIGGIAGGIDAALDGRNFFSGRRSENLIHEFALSNDVATNGDIYRNEEELRIDYDSNIGQGMSLDAVERKIGASVELVNRNNIPDGYAFNDNSGFLQHIGDNSENIGGITVQGTTGRWFPTITNKIFISPGVKGYDMFLRNAIFKHEFIHGWHFTTFGGGSKYDLYTENIAYQYSYVYVKSVSHLNYLMDFYRDKLGPGPLNMGWRVFNKIVPLWLK